MSRHFCLGLFVLLSCSLLEALPYPTLNEETTILPFELTTGVEDDLFKDKEERSLMYEEGTNSQDNTREIIDKIKAINDAITKPHKKPQINWNSQPNHSAGSNILDKDVLEKLQQIIAQGKLNSYKNNLNLQDENTVSDIEYLRHSRQMAAQFSGNSVLPMTSPYLTSIPVLVVPSPVPSMLSYNNVNSMQLRQTGMNNFLNSMQSSQPSYQTRQGTDGSSSFLSSFQWPFASLFPILIRDPLLSSINGGGWNNFISYGQEADVCRRQKSAVDEDVQNNAIDHEDVLNALNSINTRQGRAIKKRTVSHQTRLQEVDNTKKTKKIFSTKPLTTRKPVKQDYTEQQDTKTVDEGDLRFPFGDFTLFGNRKPVAPSPGFFINRLKVRRGGVAIAGPGGVATAGRGGTAIVGPGGLAYTQPGGLAVAGPAARVVALSPDADMSSIISKLQAQDGSVPRSLQPITEGKVVATGPVIYYHPNPSASTQYLPFYGGAKGQYLEIKKDTVGSITSEKIVSEDKISSDNIFKNSEDSLISKVLAANLHSLRSISNNILKLHSLGRKTGRLGNTEKNRFKTQLAALGEAASNTIKLVEEIGDNVDVLYKKNATATPKYGGLDDEEENDDVVEEGVGIDADGSTVNTEYTDDDKTIIAEAKPIGLAVIGEHGLAASRPVGTAVAASGVALARPIATAIAGIDPTLLGINFQINHS